MKHLELQNEIVYVAGDLHGDYESFLNAIKLSGKDDIIFLGDYADRGECGFEIINDLTSLIKEEPRITALMGNHEWYDNNGRPLFAPCDLPHEVIGKYKGSWLEYYNSVFVPFTNKLYTSAIVNKVLFVHAGIYDNIKSREDLTKDLNKENMLWSDPSDYKGRSPRGAGCLFDSTVTHNVLNYLCVSLLIRSHEPRKAKSGEPYKEHDGKVWTVNASRHYGKPFMVCINTINLEYETVGL